MKTVKEMQKTKRYSAWIDHLGYKYCKKCKEEGNSKGEKVESFSDFDATPCDGCGTRDFMVTEKTEVMIEFPRAKIF